MVTSGDKPTARSDKRTNNELSPVPNAPPIILHCLNMTKLTFHTHFPNLLVQRGIISNENHLVIFAPRKISKEYYMYHS